MRKVHVEFVAIFLAVSILSLFSMYVASEYFQVARLSQLMSFQAWDGPGPMPLEAYPKPFGNHYFGDFLLTFRIAAQPSPYFAAGYVQFQYLPFAAVLVSPLFVLPFWVAFAGFLIAGVSVIFVSIWSLLNSVSRTDRLIVLCAVTLSGPFISVIDRGNFSLLLTALCLVAAALLVRGLPTPAAILFGLAGAIKLYPLLFLLIFVRRRDWRSIFFGTSAFLAAVLIPMSTYRGGLLANLGEAVQQFSNAADTNHALNIRAFNNSLFTLLHSVRDADFPLVSWVCGVFVDNYLFVLVGLLATVVLIACSSRSTDAEVLLVSTALLCCGPQIIASYVLLLYLVPLGVILAAEGTSAVSRKWARYSIWVIAVIFVPKGLPTWNPWGEWSSSYATYATILNPILSLLLIFGTAVLIVRRHVFATR